WIRVQRGLPQASPHELAALLSPAGDLDGDVAGALPADRFRGPNIVDRDADNDTLRDGAEVAPGERLNRTLPATDPGRTDTDGDGLKDGWEVGFTELLPSGLWQLDPTRADSDGDAVSDADEDFDADGPGDVNEDGREDLVFVNRLEEASGTDPNRVDSDGDLLRDGWEYFYAFRHSPPLPELDPTIVNENRPTDRLRVSRFVKVDAATAAAAQDAVPLSLAASENATGAWDADAAPLAELPRGTWIVRVTGDHRFRLSDEQNFTTDPTALDTDGDGLEDAFEAFHWLDPARGFDRRKDDGGLNPRDPSDAARDLDRDGLSGIAERGVAAKDPARGPANPLADDTDLGGTKDGDEARFAERVAALSGASISPLSPDDDAPEADLDFDGLLTTEELCVGRPASCRPTDPLAIDTDRDGLVDGASRPIDASGADGRRALEENVTRGAAWILVGGATFRLLGERAIGTAPDRADTDGDGLPDGYEALLSDPAGFSVALDPLVQDGLAHHDEDAVPNIDEYRAGRPAGFDETASGPWWLGSNPGRTDSDGDGARDGGPSVAGDRDFDNDGLDDLDGEDPFPTYDPDNQGIRPWTRPVDLWTWIGHPGASALAAVLGPPTVPARSATVARDTDSDGVPDRLDRASVRVVIDAVEPASIARLGEPLTVRGRVLVDEPTSASGAGVPGVTVLANLGGRSSAREDVYCATFSGSGGAFTLACPVRSSVSVAVPEGLVLFGAPGGTASWSYNTSRALGASTLTVWTYATPVAGPRGAPVRGPFAAQGPGSFAADGAFRGEATYPATGASFRLVSNTTLVLDVPAHVENGGNLSGSVALVDRLGRPVPGVPVRLRYGGTDLGATPTGPDGRVPVNVSVGRHDGPISRVFRAEFSGSGFLGETANETQIHVRIPTRLVVDPLASPVATRNASAEGRLLSGLDRPVEGERVEYRISGAVGNATTDADGRFRVTTVAPPGLEPGTRRVEIAFPGSDRHGPASIERDVVARRPAFVEIPTVEPLLLGSDRNLSGRVVDHQGRPVRSLAGEPLRVSLLWAGRTVAVRDVAGNGTGQFDLRLEGRFNGILGRVAGEVRFEGRPYYAPGVASCATRTANPTVLLVSAKDVTPGSRSDVAG
ncbi:MAG: hypothetical protein ACT4PT_12895, partial [Methanobacteriota archaeon]